MSKIEKSEQEWRYELTEEQYRILRQKGTERAFTGQYNDHKNQGNYLCAACGEKLFNSTTKFDSGCGWPSFYAPSSNESVHNHVDKTHGMIRTEVTCNACGGHLGHVFPDGPQPTGLRYCINSVSLKFSGE